MIATTSLANDNMPERPDSVFCSRRSTDVKQSGFLFKEAIETTMVLRKIAMLLSVKSCDILCTSSIGS